MKNKLILLLALILLGCEKDLAPIEYKLNKIITRKDIKVTKFQVIDSLYIGVSDKKYVHQENDTLYLISLNGMQQKLEILNLTSKKVKSIISLYMEDELIKNEFTADEFLIHNLDSIFLLSKENELLTSINVNGKVDRFWSLKNDILNDVTKDFLEIDVSNSNSMKFDSKKKLFYFKIHSPYNFDEDINYFRKNNLISFNLENQSYNRTFGEYPEIYLNDDEYFVNSQHLNYIIDFSKGEYFTSFYADHNIYQYSLPEDKLIKTIDGKSNFLDSFEYIPRGSDMQEKTNHLIKNGKYKKIIYNKFKDEFYRVVIHNQELKSSSGKLNNMTFGRDFSIIIFDKNLNKKSELVFKDSNFFNIVEHPKGLMSIRKDNNNENINIFEVYHL